MKSQIARLTALAAYATLLAGVAVAEIRILAVSGIVRVTAPGSVNFSQALRGMVLPEGTGVVTMETGKVRIEVSPGNIVSLHANSTIRIASAKPRASGFQLLAGRLKGVFSRMASDERFELQFANSGAVASVKGTTLSAEQHGKGYKLNTIFGEVELKRDGRSVIIPQGSGWNGVRLEALSEAEISDALSETSDPDAAKKRGELHGFANDVKTNNANNQEVVTQVHENDFAVGRTLRDVHGNLARVEQILSRPNGSTIQFVNLVKRTAYSTANSHFAYPNARNAPRFDYLEGRITFDRSLPDSIADWPAFFQNNQDVKALEGQLTMANGAVSDPGRDVLTRREDLRDRPEGVEDGPAQFTFISGTQQPQVLIADSTYPELDSDHGDGGEFLSVWGISHFYVDTDGLSRDKTAADPATAPLVASTSANADRRYSTGVDKHVVMRVEGFGIDQTGSILSLNSIIANGTQDPIGYAKTLAVEGIISFMDRSNGDADMMQRGNIDLIFIPDIIIAIATKYAPSLGSITPSGD